MPERSTTPGSVPERTTPEPPGAPRPTPASLRSRFHRLPERVRPEDTVESHDPLPRADPTAGRDVERDAMLRVAGLTG